MKPTNEELMAYADGELGPEESARMEALIADDRELVEQVKLHRATRAASEAAYQSVDEVPLSDGLAALVEQMKGGEAGTAQITPLADEHTRKVRPLSNGTFWPIAAAACFAFGLVFGQFGRGTSNSNDMFVWKDGQSVAGEQLANVLTSQASDEQNGTIRVTTSFIAENGKPCRQFEHIGETRTGGIACFENQSWLIVILAALPAPGTYQAAGAGADPLAATALALGVAKKLNLREEAELIADGWGGEES